MNRLAVFCLGALLFAGCQTYDIVQRNVFVNDDGYIVNIEYGRAEKEHHSKFIAPLTGKELDYHSHLLIIVELPDGDKLKAWQCMNLFGTPGTMYRTDDEEWYIEVSGFAVQIYQRTLEDKNRYVEVYSGMLCASPKNDDARKQDKWRKLKKDAYGQWH